MSLIAQSLRIAVAVGALVLTSTSSATEIQIFAAADSGMLNGDATIDPFPGILYSELDTNGIGTVWLSVLKFDLT